MRRETILKSIINSAPDELKFIFFANKAIPQRLDKHPEGNVMKHIMVVTQRAINQFPDDMDIIMAAFFHDLGKYLTYEINPKTGLPAAHGHEKQSAEYVKQFSDWIESMGADPQMVHDIVLDHMKIKNIDTMRPKKREDLMNQNYYEKLEKFSSLDKGGWVEPKLKEMIREKVKLVLEQESERYMFFSNIEQMKRQCELLLNLPKDQIEAILDDGHDWAQDHIAIAKENMDQVFDFIMNETETNNTLTEGKKNVPTNPSLWSRAKSLAKKKFKVYPSAYANGWAAKWYKSKGGKWKTK